MTLCWPFVAAGLSLVFVTRVHAIYRQIVEKSTTFCKYFDKLSKLFRNQIVGPGAVVLATTANTMAPRDKVEFSPLHCAAQCPRGCVADFVRARAPALRTAFRDLHHLRTTLVVLAALLRAGLFGVRRLWLHWPCLPRASLCCFCRRHRYVTAFRFRVACCGAAADENDTLPAIEAATTAPHNVSNQ